MAAEDLITSTGTTVTHDETALLQNSSVTPDVPGDANDDDVAVSTLPSPFSTRLITLGFDPDDAIGAAQSGKSNGNVTDNVIQITGTGITDLAFTDANGDPLDGNSSGLYTTGGVTDGEEVFLFTDEVNNNIVLGKTEGGDIVFAIYLEETGTPLSGAKMWTVQYESLDHDDPDNPDDPDRLDLTDKVFVTANQSINFGFAGAPSGSNLFMTFGNPNSTQIVVIGEDPLNQSEGGLINTKDVLNISQAGSTTSFGVNGNQINTDEGAFITYVTGANTNFLVPNLDQNEADVEANIDFQNVVDATAASFTVNQTNPGVGPISITITAYSTDYEPGAGFVDGLTDDDQVDIATVEVVDFVKKQGKVTFEPAVFDNGDGTFTITGLSTGDQVKWTTDDPHNRILIQNTSNTDADTTNDNNTFDIGGFSIDQAASDTDEVGSKVLFEDDGPVASGETESATVQEDDLSIAAGDLSDGIDEAGDPPTDVATGSVAALVTAGADEPATFSLSADTASLPQTLTSKGDAVTYLVSGDTLTASAGGREVFTLVLAANGDYTFDLNDQLDHANGSGDLATLAIDLSSVLVATDFDGDSVTPPDETFVINVENDVPAASGETESATVQEDDLSIAAGDLSDGIDEAGDPPTDVATGSVAALVTAGADEPATFSLSADTESLPQTLTSKGDAVTYSVSGDTLTASAGGRTVFTLVLAANGDYTFDLNDQLDHANGSGDLATLAIDLSSVLVATDFDGDSVTPPDETFVINVENDVPTIGDISDGLVDFVKGDSVTNPLNGVVGADEPATYSVASSPATLTILDGTSSQLALLRDINELGTEVTYFKDVDSSGTRNAGDVDFFKLTLEDGNYTFDVLQDPPPAEVNFGFAGAPSGSNLFMTFGAPTGPQIVVIGEDPLNQSEGGLINTKDVLNISQAGSTTSFGVNGNQINTDEGAFITYVTGANTNFLVPNLDQNEADVEANIDFQNVFDATSASFTVNQTNPGVGPISITITAYSTDYEPGAGFVDGLTDDDQVDIATVEVVDFVKKQGKVTFEPAVFDNGDGTFTITGLSTGDQVKWTTDDPHNRILIQNTSNTDADTTNDNNTFDIGGFSLAQAQPAPDEKLDFTVQIADADGDTATSEIFSIGIDGTGTNDDDHVDGVNPDGLLIV